VIRLIVIALVAGALASVAPRAARAQEAPASEPRRLSGGLLFGANFSDYGGSEVLETPEVETDLIAREQIAAGGFVSYAFGPSWSLRIEALYQARGARASGALLIPGPQPVSITFAVDHTMRYVQVPIVLQRSISYDGHIVPRVYAGASIGVMLTSRFEGEAVVPNAMGTTTTYSGEADIEDVSGRIDLGALVGAGIGFPAWHGRLLVDARFEMFVTRAVDGRYTITIDDLGDAVMDARSLRNRGLSLLVGFEL
jgi:hypothetical protein